MNNQGIGGGRETGDQEELSDVDRLVLNLANSILRLARQNPDTHHISSALNRASTQQPHNVPSQKYNTQQVQETTQQTFSNACNSTAQKSEAHYDSCPPSMNSKNVHCKTGANDDDDHHNTISAAVHDDTVGNDPSTSLFVNNWVSKGGTIDVRANKSHRQYPDGERTYQIENSSAKKPVLSWASQLRGKGKNKVAHCLGVWMCPSFGEGCYHRHRPACPRYGSSKYSTKGKIPEPKHDELCPIHRKPLILMTCKARWKINRLCNSTDAWQVIHCGFHNHPAPRPVHASPESEAVLSTIMRYNPGIDTTGLMIGKSTRPPAADIDQAYSNVDYLKHRRKSIQNAIDSGAEHIRSNNSHIHYSSAQHPVAYDSSKKQQQSQENSANKVDASWLARKAMREDVSKRTTGLRSIADCVDQSQEFVRQLKASYPLFRVASLLGESKRDENIGPYYIFQGKLMREEFLTTPNPHETDTIESISDSLFFDGKVNVTVTSGWSPTIERHIPYLVSVLPAKDGLHYAQHFDYLFKPYRDLQHDSFDEFCEYYPGNTSDMSKALQNGWTTSMNDLASEVFEDNISQSKVESMYGYCLKHYNSGVVATSNISKIVDPKKKEDFIKRGLALPGIKTYEKFEKAVRSLIKEFPNTIPWICWYLQDDRRSIIFRACKALSPLEMEKFNKLKKTSNGQEGLGGFMKMSFGPHVPLVGNELLQNICSWLQIYENKLQSARDGHRPHYRRRTKSDKQKSNEPKQEYKAPDSSDLMEETARNLLLRSPLRRKQFPTTIPVNAPPQLNNVASCCFANTWLQIVMSSDPMRSAMLPALDISHPDRSPCQPFDDFRSMMNKYEEMIRRKQPGVVDMSDIVCILRWIEAKMRTKTDRGYSYGQQICPLQFFQYIREQLEENGHRDHPILTELFLLSQIVSHRTCPCRPDTQVCVENCPDNMALSISHTNTSGCLLSDCINAHFTARSTERISAKEDHHNSCTHAEVEERLWMSPLQGSREKVLLICLTPFLEDQTTPVPPSKIAQPELTLDLTKYVLPSDVTGDHSTAIRAELTGYISYEPAIVDKDTEQIIRSPHYVSVTKSRTSQEFFLSDDLNAANPLNLGSEVQQNWPSPYTYYVTRFATTH